MRQFGIQGADHRETNAEIQLSQLPPAHQNARTETNPESTTNHETENRRLDFVHRTLPARIRCPWAGLEKTRTEIERNAGKLRQTAARDARELRTNAQTTTGTDRRSEEADRRRDERTARRHEPGGDAIANR